MTTRELVRLLQDLDPSGNLEVINTRYSDYSELGPEDVDLREGVKKPSAGYIMRSHLYQMSAEDMANVRWFVHFSGN